MLTTSLSRRCWVTSYHSFCKNSNSLAFLDVLWPSIFLVISLQIFNMVQIWRLEWPRQTLDLVTLHPDLDSQIITDPPPYFTVGARHCGLWASPGKMTSWKLDYSEMTTLLPSSTDQFLWSLANLSLALLCFSLMKGFFSGFAWLQPCL